MAADSYPAVPRVNPDTSAADAAIGAFIANLGQRKEFFTTRYHPVLPPDPSIPGFKPGALALLQIPGMRPHGAQLFVENFFAPETPFSRLLLEWQTGAGKTTAALRIGQNYARLFRQYHALTPAARPTIHVVGFTKGIFFDEMLRHPELGFVSRAEVEEIRRLRVVTEASPSADLNRQLASFVGTIRRRATDRARGGYYTFYGYKEFAHKLFGVTAKGERAGVDVRVLYATAPEEEGDAQTTFAQRLTEEVRKGHLVINDELLQGLKGGLMFCDEIQDVYNMQVTNNYGIAIQYALDTLGDAAPRVIFMSATPMTGSAAEVVDLLNLLVPRSELPGGAALRREDFFSGGGRAAHRRVAPRKKKLVVEAAPEEEKEKTDGATSEAAAVDGVDAAADEADEREDAVRASVLLPGALERIGRLSAGRVSFLLDVDTESYPRRVFEGVEVGIPYLRFRLCPASPFHERTIARAARLRDTDGDTVTEDTNPMRITAHALYDLAFPNPAFAPDAALTDPESYGLYESGNTAEKLTAAPPAWRATAGVSLLRGAEAGATADTVALSGGFLVAGTRGPAGRPLIGAYSGKFAELIREVLARMRAGPGKLMIYHYRVRMAGVLLIQEMLRMNGFADETSDPTDATLCAVCGIARGTHNAPKGDEAVQGHSYTPARFVVAHSDVDTAVMKRSIANYNSPSNVDGYRFRILLGSKIISASYSLRAVREQYVLSLPTDIPTLIQVFGRVVRKGSHLELSPDQRAVNIHVFVTVPHGTDLKAKEYQYAALGPEMRRYADKMREYLVIQEVERALRRYAVDGFANYPKLVAVNPALATAASLDSLPYLPLVELGSLRPPLAVETFEAYGKGEQEVATIAAILRVLFGARPVWTYEDAWEAVRAGTVRGVGYDASLFGEGNYALALQSLQKPYGAPPVRVLSAPPYFVLVSAGGAPPEAYLDAVLSRPSGPLRVRLAGLGQEQKRRRLFDAGLRGLAGYFRRGVLDDAALVDLPGSFHEAMQRALVESDGSVSVSGHAEWDAALVSLYRRFRLLLTADDVQNRVASSYRGEVAALAALGEEAPVAVVGAKTVSVLILPQPAESVRWQEFPPSAFGVERRHRENPVCVGFAVEENGAAKFKVRPPIAARGTHAAPGDRRLLERGAVCETRTRGELMAAIAGLESGVTQRRALAGVPVGELCSKLKKRLLALEEAARASGEADALRYLYLYNERSPLQ